MIEWVQRLSSYHKSWSRPEVRQTSRELDREACIAYAWPLGNSVDNEGLQYGRITEHWIHFEKSKIQNTKKAMVPLHATASSIFNVFR